MTPFKNHTYASRKTDTQEYEISNLESEKTVKQESNISTSNSSYEKISTNKYCISTPPPNTPDNFSNEKDVFFTDKSIIQNNIFDSSDGMLDLPSDGDENEEKEEILANNHPENSVKSDPNRLFQPTDRKDSGQDRDLSNSIINNNTSSIPNELSYDFNDRYLKNAPGYRSDSPLHIDTPSPEPEKRIIDEATINNCKIELKNLMIETDIYTLQVDRKLENLKHGDSKKYIKDWEKWHKGRCHVEQLFHCAAVFCTMEEKDGRFHFTVPKERVNELMAHWDDEDDETALRHSNHFSSMRWNQTKNGFSMEANIDNLREFKDFIIDKLPNDPDTKSEGYKKDIIKLYREAAIKLIETKMEEIDIRNKADFQTIHVDDENTKKTGQYRNTSTCFRGFIKELGENFVFYFQMRNHI